MQVSIETRSAAEARADLLAVPLFQQEEAAKGKKDGKSRLPARVAALDRALDGRLSRVLEAGDFRGKARQTLLLYGEGALPTARILLVGLGPEEKVDAAALREATAAAVSATSARQGERVALLAPSSRRLRAADQAQAVAEGAVLGAYRFDRYRGKRDDAPGRVKSLALLVEARSDLRGQRAALRRGVVLAESQNLARDLSNEIPSVLTPEAMAREARRVAREVGLRVRVLGVAELRKRGMGAILAVGQGSAHPPRLIVLEHNAPSGGKRSGRRRPTVCLVGKGITFDSGGLSLKPSTSMVKMKHDMSGGAAVIGAMRAVALLKLPLHVVGVIGAAENMPSGTAYRPDDIVRTYSGRTVQIANTDAEGRLVLADSLHYARSEYEPAAMVDLATLTGACQIALGPWAAALLSNHEGLSQALREAGETVDERLWPLPLWDVHKQHMRGDIADVKQTGGRQGGTITAAAFLWHFVAETPWAHLDIASTADTEQSRPLQPAGATGFGVRTLVEFLRGWDEHGID